MTKKEEALRVFLNAAAKRTVDDNGELLSSVPDYEGRTAGEALNNLFGWTVRGTPAARNFSLYALDAIGETFAARVRGGFIGKANQYKLWKAIADEPLSQLVQAVSEALKA